MISCFLILECYALRWLSVQLCLQLRKGQTSQFWTIFGHFPHLKVSGFWKNLKSLVIKPDANHHLVQMSPSVHSGYRYRVDTRRMAWYRMRHLQGLQVQVKPNMRWGGEGLQNIGHGIRMLRGGLPPRPPPAPLLANRKVKLTPLKQISLAPK